MQDSQRRRFNEIVRVQQKCVLVSEVEDRVLFELRSVIATRKKLTRSWMAKKSKHNNLRSQLQNGVIIGGDTPSLGAKGRTTYLQSTTCFRCTNTFPLMHVFLAVRK